ncbi:NAD(P)H-dependent oxidoreductase [Mucilaginibacter sp. Bleaf8]|uniref:NADPH-dependent FMN reductase n=1 Tax=Mucilaginibacter sp. Bleaf8 TaxID=2834430 RepID=UPI001BD0AA82|nr:NAD(P)H-dependent oxidoreductase [Mucilaginibacter sp. Bleaf8]MBS7564210.1 NAD(P)H-dependent oxidoreductase [Mucilaginibacter sp. Bleaf8]
MITIVASTNRPDSSTLKLSKYYQKLLSDKGLTANLLSLMDLPSAFIQTDMFGKRSAEFEPIQKLITDTQKFLFVIPEYNGSFPGVLKAFIDACEFPSSFYDKKAALVGLSSGKYGNIRGVEHFTGVCNYMHMHILPLKLHIPAIHKELDAEGNLFQPDTVKFVNEQVTKFINY